VRIKAGEYDVLASGTVIGFRNEPIDFTLTEGERPLVVRFVFRTDEENPGQRTEPKIENDRQLSLAFVNFTNVLGTGNVGPLPLGQVEGRRLYLYYRIYSLSKEPEKLVHYTWYLGERVDQ